MEEKKQEVREEKSSVVVLDRGVAVTDADIRQACCGAAFLPIR